MHAVLDLQANRTISKQHETLKERLRETRSSCLLVHDDRAQLLVVANEYDLLASKDEGDHTFCKSRVNTGLQLEGRRNIPGSAACVASSISTVLNLDLLNLGSPAPTQVQQITSAAPKISFSHCRIRVLYLRSSLLLNSPCSFLSWISFWSSMCVVL